MNFYCLLLEVTFLVDYVSTARLLSSSSLRSDVGVGEGTGGIGSSSSNVESLAGLYFEREPQDAVVARSRQHEIHCVAATSMSTSPSASTSRGRAAKAAPSGVEYEWYQDDEAKPLKGTDLRQVLQNGTLVFTRFVQRVEGRYHCLARLRGVGAIISRPATLTLARLVTSQSEDGVTQQQQLSRAIGDTLRLVCGLRGDPTPTVTWVKDDVPIRLDARRFTVLPSGVLLITNATTGDAGTYKCSAINIAGRLTSLPIKVTVSGNRSPHQFLVEPRDATAELGSEVFLECLSTGSQSRITWKKDGRKLSLSGDRHALIGRGSLRISDVTLEDEGSYECESITGGRATVITSSPAHLSVHVPPQVRAKSSYLNVHVPQKARLACECSGIPELKVTWFKDGVAVEGQGQVTIKGCQLTIWQVAAVDAGFYQCRAENGAGMAQATVQLVVAPLDYTPDPPVDVRAKTVTSTLIELAWQANPSNRNHPIIAYTVHIVRQGERQAKQKVVPGNSVVVDHLTPFTNYTFRVIAFNNVTASAGSTELTVQTSEDVPTVAPDVSLTNYGAAAVRVTWSRLPVDRARGRVVEHKLFYRQAGKLAHSVETIDGDVLEFLITGLEPSTTYECRVLAATVGYPMLDFDWPWQSITTLPSPESGSRSEEAVHLTVQSVDGLSLMVSWLPAADAIGYKINCATATTDDDDESTFNHQSILSASNLSTMLTNLTTGLLYKVSVTPVMTNREGRTAFRYVRTRNETSGRALALMVEQLPAVQDVEMVAVSATEIHVSWEEPITVSKLKHYTVHYEPTHAVIGSKDERKFTYSYRSIESDIVLSGLEPLTLYAVVVTYETQTGESPASREVQVMTLEGPPPAPGKLTLEVVSSSSVRAAWKAPVHRGTVIEYKVTYTSMYPETDRWWTTVEVNGTTSQAIIDDLEPNTVYYFKVKAKSGAGEGPYSNIQSVNVTYISAATGSSLGLGERELGIVLGVCIGLGCVIICITLLLIQHNCLKKRRELSRRRHRYGSQASNMQTVSPGPSLPELSHVLITPGTFQPKPGQQYTLNGYVLTAPSPHYPTLSHDLRQCHQQQVADGDTGGGDSREDTPIKEEVNDDDVMIDTSRGNPQDDSHAEEEDEEEPDLDPDDDVFEHSGGQLHARAHNADETSGRGREGAVTNNSGNNKSAAFIPTDFHRGDNEVMKADEGEPLLYRAGLGQAWLAIDQPMDSNVSSVSSVRSSDCYSDGHDVTSTSIPPLRFDDVSITPRCDSYIQSQDLPPPTDDIRLDSYCDQSDDEGAGFTAEEDDNWSESNDTATLPLRGGLEHGMLTVEV